VRRDPEVGQDRVEELPFQLRKPIELTEIPPDSEKAA